MRHHRELRRVCGLLGEGSKGVHIGGMRSTLVAHGKTVSGGEHEDDEGRGPTPGGALRHWSRFCSIFDTIPAQEEGGGESGESSQLWTSPSGAPAPQRQTLLRRS